jgi:hypothetical protein
MFEYLISYYIIFSISKFLFISHGISSVILMLKFLNKKSSMVIALSVNKSIKSCLFIDELCSKSVIRVYHLLVDKKYKNDRFAWFPLIYLLKEVLKKNQYIVLETSISSIRRFAKRYMDLCSINDLNESNDNVIKELDLQNENIELVFDDKIKEHEIFFKILPPPKKFYFYCGKINRKIYNVSNLINTAWSDWNNKENTGLNLSLYTVNSFSNCREIIN